VWSYQITTKNVETGKSSDDLSDGLLTTERVMECFSSIGIASIAETSATVTEQLIKQGEDIYRGEEGAECL